VEGGVNFIKSIRWWILDLIFPETCFGCRKKGSSLCDNCILKIRKAERETESSIYAVYDYRDPLIKRAIWDLKYHNRINLGRKLGQLLYGAFIEEVSDMRIYSSGQPLLVIPVPLSPTRRKKRGYNQAEIIAKEFALCGGKEVLELQNNIVKKRIDTKPQAKITNRNERLRNIKDVFEIKNPSFVKGRTIIIIDDVTTTGGTIKEIIKLLKNSGAKKVVGFAIAH
jgi:ComF family protein